MARKRQQGGQTNNAAMPVMRPDAAGIDIGAAEIFVAVPGDRTAENVRSFPTFTQDLYLLADRLKACGIETVAMESTEGYWMPLFRILEKRGFDVCLVNARRGQCAPGDPRSGIARAWRRWRRRRETTGGKPWTK